MFENLRLNIKKQIEISRLNKNKKFNSLVIFMTSYFILKSEPPHFDL